MYFTSVLFLLTLITYHRYFLFTNGKKKKPKALYLVSPSPAVSTFSLTLKPAETP